MREFVINYRFVLICAVIALLATFTVYALSGLDIEPSQYGAKAPNTNVRSLAYRGVSFTYNGSFASEIKAETKPAYALESETDTGQGVAPEHIIFRFVGEYASRNQSSTFSPEIFVYPIADFKKALAKSESYVRRFEAKIQTLKRILSEQPSPWEKEVPFLPFEIGASQGFHARMKYVNFQNGKGVLFLTQYNIEPALINNQGLTYTFQGLTDDSVYYVSAIFPVSAPILPQNYEAESTENYTLIPPRSFRGREYELFESGYRVYLTKLTEKLEKLPPDRYQPNLAVLEDLIRSLNVARH